MPVYINVPSYGIPNSGTPASDISYTNESMPGVTNISEAINYILEHKVEVVPGKGLSSNDFTNELLDKLNSLEKQLEFGTFLEFPPIGEEGVVYVDTNANTMYLWDSNTGTYTGIVLEMTGNIIQSIL